MCLSSILCKNSKKMLTKVMMFILVVVEICLHLSKCLYNKIILIIFSHGNNPNQTKIKHPESTTPLQLKTGQE